MTFPALVTCLPGSISNWLSSKAGGFAPLRTPALSCFLNDNLIFFFKGGCRPQGAFGVKAPYGCRTARQPEGLSWPRVAGRNAALSLLHPRFKLFLCFISSVLMIISFVSSTKTHDFFNSTPLCTPPFCSWVVVIPGYMNAPPLLFLACRRCRRCCRYDPRIVC